MLHSPPDLEIELAGERIFLLPDYAMYWPRQKALLVADTHWGKDATFRVNGIPVPNGSLQEDLTRLDQLLTYTQAEKLIILGDLLHAQKGRTPTTVATVSEWRKLHNDLDVLLVRGNHDERAGDPPDEWHFHCVDAPYLLEPFVLQHIPTESTEGYVLAGHLHPGVVLNGKGRQSIKLPCFWFGKRVGILPAFGSFTGLASIRPKLGDCVYVVVEGEIIQVA